MQNEKLDWFRLERPTATKFKNKRMYLVKKDESYTANTTCRSDFPISCIVTFRYKRKRGKFWAADNKNKLRLLEAGFIKMLTGREHTLITAIVAVPESCRCLFYTRNIKDLILCIQCLRLSFRRYFFITCFEPDSLWEIYDAL
ncbi:hypothetical protein [Taibaiella chishuiensis]|nr:hypothetical protein [Taibaiella chishuiensis]